MKGQLFYQAIFFVRNYFSYKAAGSNMLGIVLLIQILILIDSCSPRRVPNIHTPTRRTIRRAMRYSTSFLGEGKLLNERGAVDRKFYPNTGVK